MGSSNRKQQPPYRARSFLRWFLKEELVEEVEGDLLEQFEARAGKSIRRARRGYWMEVISYLRPFAIRHFNHWTNFSTAMLSNYLKITFRSLVKQWQYGFINILGLSISTAIAFLMLLWVYNESSTDRYHEKRTELWRVKRLIPMEGNRMEVYRNISYPLLQSAMEELPEVKRYAMLPASFNNHLQVGDKIIRATGAYANADYFEIFTVPVLSGDVKQLDLKVNSIAISESLAERFFGLDWKVNAFGSTLHIHDKGDFSIEAIYEDFPPNSSIQNEFLYSFQSFLTDNEWILEWGNNGMQGVLELGKGADPKAVGDKLQAIFHAQQSGDLKEGCFLQPFEDDYLYSQFDDQGNVSGGRIEYIRIFLGAAFLLILISSINFINLATARAAERALEVGIRKTVGASRTALIGQFLCEALIITLLSLVIGLALARFLVPNLELMTQREMLIPYNLPVFWWVIIGTAAFIAIFSGSYPAFILSAFRPIQVVKGMLKEKMHGITFRKVLVTIQFTLALLLIVSAVVVRSQVIYIQTKNLGLQKDNIVMIHQDAKITEKYPVIRQSLEDHEEILGVTVAGPNPLAISASTGGVVWPKKRPDQANIEIAILWCAHNFPDVFDIPLVAGRFYRESDFPDSVHIVLNEKAVEIMELGPDPIGKTIQWWGSTKQVIGVLKDFHNQSLYRDIQPVGFLLDPENAGNLFIRSEPTQVKHTIATLKEIFREVVPDVPLYYEFLDDRYRARYNSEILTGKLADYFAILSILISCLGLLGLVTFVAEQKTKEIGIRKILGASTLSIVGLMSRDFMRLIFFAFLIAIPLSYILGNKWLDRFTFQVSFNWWIVFLLAGLGALIITFITIGLKSVKAAMSTPLKSIRSE